jgi:proteasome assembly chaperone (PAC2) family protein
LPVDLPEYRFFFWKHPKGIGDLIVFIADNQPIHPKGYGLARIILKVANLLGARRIYTAAALACSISHMDAPQVWAVATHPEILEELKRFPVKLLSEGHISGLNGLILGIGKQMGFEGACLLGELPYYTIGMDNPKASLAVLEQLSSLWEIDVDLTDLRDDSIRKEIEIEEFIRTGNQKIIIEEMISKEDKDSGSPQ